MRTGDEAEARRVLDRTFKAFPFDQVTFNLLALLDKLEKFEVVQDGDLDLQVPSGRSEGPARVRDPARPGRAQEAVGGVPVHAEGADPDRDLSGARRLRGPQPRSARARRRARRLLRPRREHGFAAGQGARDVLVAGDALARAGARRHAADVEPARAALADRRHVGVRGRPREAGVGRRDGGAVRDGARARAGAEAEGSEFGFTKPDTIALAYYQASLLVEHIVATRGEAALRTLVRVYGDGVEGDAAISKGLGISIDELQGDVRQDAGRSGSAPLRAALRDVAKPAKPGDERQSGDIAALKAAASDRPGSYRAQLALGAALAKQGDKAAFEPLEKAAALVPMAIGADSPHAIMGRLAEQLGDPARAIKEYRGAARPRSHRHRRGAPADRARGEGRRSRSVLAFANDRIVELDPFDAAGHTGLGRVAMRSRDAAVAMREFKVALAIGPADRASAHCDLAESYLLAGRAGGCQAGGARRARDRAELRARAGPAAQGYRRRPGAGVQGQAQVAMTTRRPGLARLASGAWCGQRARLARDRRAGARRRRCAERRRASTRRFAGLQWTFARIRYDGSKLPGLSGCDTYDECWTIDYPAAEQNLSRRVKTVTSIQVNEPAVVSIDDPALFTYPWIYLVEPGTWIPKDNEVEILREFLLRGGTMTFDDFHGPIEWANLERQMKRIFPDRAIVDLPPDASDLSLLLQDRRVSADARASGRFCRPDVGKGRLCRPSARHRRRQRPRDGPHQLEHRHGRWLGVVERRRLSGVRPVHRAGLPDADQRNRLLADALINR